jgi:hypothetical protein
VQIGSALHDCKHYNERPKVYILEVMTYGPLPQGYNCHPEIRLGNWEEDETPLCSVYNVDKLTLTRIFAIMNNMVRI